MRTLFLTLFMLSGIAYAQDTSDCEIPPASPSDFQTMFDTNDSYGGSVRQFDRQLWSEQGTVSMSIDPTLRIKLAPNIFLKTMAIVNINTDAVRTGMIGIDQILFGLEIRFEGF